MASQSPTSQPGFFRVYLEQEKEKDLAVALNNQAGLMEGFLASISEEQSMFAYAPGKWTIKEMLQHVIDAERIFAYRALCFARKETVTLPGFDENDYATASNANHRSWEQLRAEFACVRQSTLFLFESFTPEMMDQVGKASVNTLSVNELGFLIAGHCNHHKRIIEERYLS